MTSYTPDSQLINELPLINCRELGGMPLAGGKEFRKGLFLRSGSPEWLTEEEVALVKSYGVKNVIDLRGKEEVKLKPGPFANDPDVNYQNISLFDGNPNDDSDPAMQFFKDHTLGDYYIIISEMLGERVAQVMRVLLNSEGITLFHCLHGKDRTGVTAAILYLICGASREDIINNYKVSYDYIKDFIEPMMRQKPDNMKHALRSDADNMVIYLNYIDSKWNGDITNMLRADGLTACEIDAIRNKCIAD